MQTERRPIVWPCLATLVLAGALACGSEAPPAAAPPEVWVVEAAARDVPQISEWLGTTEGSVDAEIRAQVAGYLVSRDYREGARVTKDELLFRIDPRPFRAALDQARGDLRRAEAALERSRLDVARYQPLVREGAVSQQEYDNAVQRLRGDEAAVQSARAAAERAEIELGFTEIRAPIAGIVGVAQRQLGDFVSPSDPTPLTTLSQIDPIQVEFPLSEREYLRFAPAFQEALSQGRFREGTLEIVLADGSVYPHRGTGYPAGREIDPRTGTITVKGVFPNPEQLLRPGQYARIRVVTGLLPGAVVVPERAIQELQGLGQVAVVGADEKVEVRTVELGPSWGTLRVVAKGVAAGERVVVEGFQKVRPGMAVTARPAPPERAGAPPEAGPAPGAEPPPPAQASGLPTAQPPPEIQPPASPPPATATSPPVPER
jgi:membrane fusion protein (multidrug efflux system)